ncbi:hypothetical protein E2C01_053652 [Portunus trituberculatus]|uniref:Uncharacterized protein n=1 Tax=Portunus trituberculatus TaxID=210409 RepID=A0A5B7GRE2_PORTR|nr:hypothetical protein [Portunus trituberculatus]
MKECLASRKTDLTLYQAEYHLLYAFSTKRWVSDTDTVNRENQHNTFTGHPNWQ